MIPNPISIEQRHELGQIRDAMLTLHKTLLDLERAAYERTYGPILSAGAYLQLVLGHEQFAWLRELSSLVAAIDEALAPRSTARADEAAALLEQARRMLMPAESGSVFQGNYWKAIQDHPDVLLQHAQIVKLVR